MIFFSLVIEAFFPDLSCQKVIFYAMAGRKVILTLAKEQKLWKSKITFQSCLSLYLFNEMILRKLLPAKQKVLRAASKWSAFLVRIFYNCHDLPSEKFSHFLQNHGNFFILTISVLEKLTPPFGGCFQEILFGWCSFSTSYQVPEILAKTWLTSEPSFGRWPLVETFFAKAEITIRLRLR